MNIHEYQAKSLLAKAGVPVPMGHVAFSVDEALNAANMLGGPIYVVKSQIHAGGRGAGRFKTDPNGKGGVRVVKSVADVKANAAEMLNQTLVTKQTGPEGKVVQRLYIEDGCDIDRELYLSLVMDRATARVTIMACAEGGMEIEEIAHRNPEAILKVAIDPVTGISGFHCRKVAFFLGLKGDEIKSLTKFLNALYSAFWQYDVSLMEINPLVVTKKGDVIALDAKMNFDDNALYRQKDIAAMRDPSEEDPVELEAARHELNYVKLDGSIGCMVNGAGLAMATMDIIQLKGGSPANFLDVGGGATKERVTTAFKIILSDPNVKGILVNIFGGIMRCDIIAEGVIAASREVNLKVPLVVRLEGTNVELGKKLMAESGLPIISANNLADAAEKIVNAVKEG